MFEPEAFNKVASGIQSIATAIGIVAAGGWAMFTFNGQHLIQRANLEIQKIEHDSLEQPILRSTISPTGLTDGGYPSAITVTLKNDGKRALQFENTTISLVPIPKNGAPQTDKPQLTRLPGQLIGDEGKFSNAPGRILRSGQDRNLAFILPKLDAGTYFVELRTIYFGMEIVDGKFIRSKDEEIDSIDQAILSIPSKMAPQK
jgi:hypothetical protein